jgi:hypothetical protein
MPSLGGFPEAMGIAAVAVEKQESEHDKTLQLEQSRNAELQDTSSWDIIWAGIPC